MLPSRQSGAADKTGSGLAGPYRFRSNPGFSPGASHLHLPLRQSLCMKGASRYAPFLAFTLVIIISLAMAGCTTSPAPTLPPGMLNGMENAVIIKNFAFSPQTISIRTGSSVTWVNQDTVNHTVVSDPRSPRGIRIPESLVRGIVILHVQQGRNISLPLQYPSVNDRYDHGHSPVIFLRFPAEILPKWSEVFLSVVGECSV